MLLKLVLFDTNSYNEDGTYWIDDIVIRGKNLKIGERVIVYQDNEEWEAEITFDGENWGVKLLSDAWVVSDDRCKGRHEGFYDGYYCQLRFVDRVLEQLDIKEDVRKEVLRRLLQ